jgi:hypothetical protein
MFLPTKQIAEYENYFVFLILTLLKTMKEKNGGLVSSTDAMYYLNTIVGDFP